MESKTTKKPSAKTVKKKKTLSEETKKKSTKPKGRSKKKVVAPKKKITKKVTQKKKSAKGKKKIVAKKASRSTKKSKRPTELPATAPTPTQQIQKTAGLIKVAELYINTIVVSLIVILGMHISILTNH